MLIAIQVAVNPTSPGWEKEFKEACEEVWKKTETASKAIVVGGHAAGKVMDAVAREMGVPIYRGF